MKEEFFMKKWIIYSNKIRKVTFIFILTILIVAFIIVYKIDTTNYTKAKEKLGQIVEDSYDTTNNSVDIPKLKDTMDNLENADTKILNPDTNDFPIITKVDGYKFQIYEDGDIKDANKITEISQKNMENIITNEILYDNTIKNTEQQNNVNYIDSENIIDDQNMINAGKANNDTEKEILIKYNDETKNYKGITVTTDTDGNVTVNGISSEKMFIKVTNGIQMATNGNENSALAKKEPIIIEAGKEIEINIKELSGNYLASDQISQFNVVLKYNNGIIAQNCKLRDNMFLQNFKSEKNISEIYLFISANIKIDNYMINTKIYEK